MYTKEVVDEESKKLFKKELCAYVLKYQMKQYKLHSEGITKALEDISNCLVGVFDEKSIFFEPVVNLKKLLSTLGAKFKEHLNCFSGLTSDLNSVRGGFTNYKV